MFDAARKRITAALEDYRRTKADAKDDPGSWVPVVPGSSTVIVQSGQTVTISGFGQPEEDRPTKPDEMPANKLDALAFHIHWAAATSAIGITIDRYRRWEAVPDDMKQHLRALAKASLEFLRTESVTYGALASLILEDAKHSGESK